MRHRHARRIRASARASDTRCAAQLQAASLSIRVLAKAGMSSGLRLVISCRRQTTSLSRHSAPAFSRSLRRDGHEVTLRPSTRSASINVHGPWQIAATGLPVVAEGANEIDRFLLEAQFVRIDHAARQNQRVEIAPPSPCPAAGPPAPSGPVAAFPALDLRGVARAHHGDGGARLFQQALGLGQLGILEAVGGQHGDAPAFQVVDVVMGDAPSGNVSCSIAAPGMAPTSAQRDRGVTASRGSRAREAPEPPAALPSAANSNGEIDERAGTQPPTAAADGTGAQGGLCHRGGAGRRASR